MHLPECWSWQSRSFAGRPMVCGISNTCLVPGHAAKVEACPLRLTAEMAALASIRCWPLIGEHARLCLRTALGVDVTGLRHSESRGSADTRSGNANDEEQMRKDRSDVAP